MIFSSTPLPGAYLIEPEPRVDERGFFARVFCRQEFSRMGLEPDICQCSLSHNARMGTLRGLHYQVEPHAEAKLVRCTRGAIYDVILDLRRDSPTFKNWFAAELSQANGIMMYVPCGVAHGFQTLVDETEVFYQMSAAFAHEFARGVRWDDPAFDITWPPVTNRIISSRDRLYQDYRE